MNSWYLLAICMCMVSPYTKPQPVMEKLGTYPTYEICVDQLHKAAEQARYSGIACTKVDVTKKKE